VIIGVKEARSMRKLLISGVAAVLLAAGSLATASAAGKTPNVFPPQSHPRGLSYGEWQVRWVAVAAR
jgi:hypothetical protein